MRVIHIIDDVSFSDKVNDLVYKRAKLSEHGAHP